MVPVVEVRPNWGAAHIWPECAWAKQGCLMVPGFRGLVLSSLKGLAGLCCTGSACVRVRVRVRASRVNPKMPKPLLLYPMTFLAMWGRVPTYNTRKSYPASGGFTLYLGGGCLSHT